MTYVKHLSQCSLLWYIGYYNGFQFVAKFGPYRTEAEADTTLTFLERF